MVGGSVISTNWQVRYGIIDRDKTDFSTNCATKLQETL
jgi:hypothetical protein